MVDEEIRKESHKLFGLFWDHLITRELKGIMSSKTAILIVAILQALVSILGSAFPVARTARMKPKKKSTTLLS